MFPPLIFFAFWFLGLFSGVLVRSVSVLSFVLVLFGYSLKSMCFVFLLLDVSNFMADGLREQPVVVRLQFLFRMRSLGISPRGNDRRATTCCSALFPPCFRFHKQKWTLRSNLHHNANHESMSKRLKTSRRMGIWWLSIPTS